MSERQEDLETLQTAWKHAKEEAASYEAAVSSYLRKRDAQRCLAEAYADAIHKLTGKSPK